ncbi:MAG TPA: phosphatase PAP2 family protein [Thermoanaerobaculia bacterium]|nr:phosphatase PAP2 family protein [Thermoanaerobaculia bacterium]
MLFVILFLLLFALLGLLFRLTGPGLERLLWYSAHRTASFRYRDYLPVFVVLGLGAAATALAGDAFLDLAESVQETSPRLHQIDTEVHQWAAAARTQGATPFFTIMTLIGTPVGLGVLVTIVAVILAFRGRWRWAAYLFVTSTVGGLLNLLLKAFFARARPELAEALRDAHGYSFPSGHAMGSTIVFGALCYLAFRVIHEWRWRAVVLAFNCSMIAAIATSRIYLGVHWISDIAAGISAGLIWLIATTVAYETFRRIRLLRSLRMKREEMSTT